MKRLVAAVTFSLLAASGFAAEPGKPFEDLDLARALPNLPEKAAAITVAQRSTASSGQTRAEQPNARTAGSQFTWATGPWANDHNFIAPAK